MTVKKKPTKKKSSVRSKPSVRRSSKSSPKRAMVSRTKVRSPQRMAIAITSLVINVFIPGIGSLIGGKVRVGLMQLLLLIIGLFIPWAYVGLVIIAVAWIWAIVTGAKLVKESK